MSEYEIPVGSGSLKLKGGLADAGKIKKKKKSKPGKNESEREREKDRVKELLKQQDKSSPSGSGRNSPAMGGSESSSRKTDAERRFEEVQKKRLEKRVAKLAKQTHKERVSEFNNHLETLSEHHDIPKVGPG